MNPAMPSQYRANYQHMPPRSTHTSASKQRGSGAPLPAVQQTPSQAQIDAAKQAANMAQDAAKRRANKPTDKNIPEGVEDLVLGDGVQQYKRLREVERKLDAVMMRKRLDIQDSAQHSAKRYKTMQVWISNTVENQPWQARTLETDMFDFNTGVEATYKVKIEGRLLDDDDLDDATDYGSDDENFGISLHQRNDEDSMDQDDETPQQSVKPATMHTRTKFSHFFKAITVDFDRGKNLQPDAATQIEWKKPLGQLNVPLRPEADFDCLEFERKGDENINCTINFYRDEIPERFRLSKELGELLDTEEEDRAAIIVGIWEYVKAMNLQQDEEKRLIQCDDRLRALFKADTFFFPELTTLITPHISPLAPLPLPYTIRVDPSFHSSPTPPATIYALRLPTPSPLPALKAPIAYLNPHPTPHPTPHATVLRQLSLYDDHLALLVSAIAHSKAKHAFLSEMSRDPVGFVNRWVKSQKRDMEVIVGEAGKGEEAMGEEWRRGGKSGAWGTENVRESVGLMVQKVR